MVIVHKQGDWLAAPVGDEILMMSAEKGTYMGMNAMGARIWTLLDEMDDSDQLCRQLCTEFAVEPDVCARDVAEFLAALAGQGAIVRQAAIAR